MFVAASRSPSYSPVIRARLRARHFSKSAARGPLLQLASIIARTQLLNNKPTCRANVGPSLMCEGFCRIGFPILALARRCVFSLGVIAALLPAASKAGVLSESDLQ